jgi:hypothetical protein
MFEILARAVAAASLIGGVPSMAHAPAGVLSTESTRVPTSSGKSVRVRERARADKRASLA